MKTKTKKLLLTLFAFASLSLAACGGGGGSSSEGGSSGGSGSDTSSKSSEKPSSSEESSEEESSDESSEEDPGSDDPIEEGYSIKLGEKYYALEEGELDQENLEEKWQIEDITLVAGEELSVFYDEVPLDFFCDMEDELNVSNTVERPGSSTPISYVTINDSAEGAGIYFKKWSSGAYSIWVTGRTSAAPEPVDPDVPVESNEYGYQINTATPVKLNEGEAFEGFEQFYVTKVTFAAGDKLQFVNLAKSESWTPATLNTHSVGFSLTTVAEKNVLECTTAGDYDIYLKLKYGADEVYIGANGATSPEGESSEPEVVPERHYAFRINGGSNNALTAGDPFEEYSQFISTSGTTFAKGDTLSFVDTTSTEVVWTPAILNPASSGFELKTVAEKLVLECTEAGNYDIYLKLKYEADEVYIGLHHAGDDAPGGEDPEAIPNNTIRGQKTPTGDWTNLGTLVANPEATNEIMVENIQLYPDCEFVFHLDGDNYRKFANIKKDSTAYADFEESTTNPGNIKLKSTIDPATRYDIYVDLLGSGESIWIQRHGATTTQNITVNLGDPEGAGIGADEAVIFVYAWNAANQEIYRHQIASNATTVELPLNLSGFLFVRMPKGSTDINWDTKWNQSANLKVEEGVLTFNGYQDGIAQFAWVK